MRVSHSNAAVSLSVLHQHEILLLDSIQSCWGSLAPSTVVVHTCQFNQSTSTPVNAVKGEGGRRLAGAVSEL